MSYRCSKCGTLCGDDHAFCGNCGTPKSNSVPEQAAPVTPNPQPAAPTPQPVNAVAPDMPMKWYKFVIYFQLFANCVLNCLSALTALTGTMYQGLADQIYTYAPGLQTLNIVFGILMIALGVYAIVVRGRMKKFCADGPKKYLAFMGMNAALAVVYALATDLIVSSSAMGAYYEADHTSMISSVCSTAVMILCCKKYFNKRSHLFVN